MSLVARRPVEPVVPLKAGPLGPGAGVLQTEYLLPMILPTDPQRKIRMALSVGSEVSWIRAAERVISGKIGGDPDLQGAVKWHLEDPEGETVDEDYKDKRAVEAYQLIDCPAGNLDSNAGDDVPEPLEDVQVTVAEYQGELWEITSRHMGLAGQGFWWLDNMDTFGIPKGILYIRPDRLFPGIDDDGNLTNWWLDPKSANRPQTGTRLELREVIQFPLEAPTHGFLADGLIESCILKAQLSGHVDKYLGSLLASSGKLSGMFAPRAGAIDDDGTWDQLVRDMRNLSEQPDAAKRIQLMRAPMEWTRTQLTVQEMAVVELLDKTRDNLLALWGVPLSQVGGSSPAGLNSGDIRKYDEAALWQNAIVMRLVPMKQRIQRRLLDRWKPLLGWAPKLVLDIPEFDDDSPRYDKVQKAMNIAMTNDERRALIGLDPFDPDIKGPTGKPLGEEVWMVNTASPIDFGGTAYQQLKVNTPGWSSNAANVPPPASSTPPAAPTGAQPTSGIPDKTPDKPSLSTMAGMGGMMPAGGAGATFPGGYVRPSKAKVEDDQAKVIPAVLAGLQKQWPNDELDVVRQGTWTFDPSFPLRKVNGARRPVPRNPKIVAGIEKEVDVGVDPKPIVVIHTKVLGKGGYTPIDGWHHTLAYVHAGLKKVPAFVGEGDAAWTEALLHFNDEIPTPKTADGKASFRDTMRTLRSATEQRVTPLMEASVRRVLDAQKTDIAGRVRSMYERIKAAPKDRTLWWPTGASERWTREMTAALEPHLTEVATTVRTHVQANVPARPVKASIAPEGAVAYVLRKGAAKVTGITQTTQDELADLIARGLDEGMGPAELGDAIEAYSGFDEYRAELIARTELMDAYNSAALGSYDEVGIGMVLAYDGDADDLCAGRDGREFTLSDAESEIEHPNGTLDWSPIVE